MAGDGSQGTPAGERLAGGGEAVGSAKNLASRNRKKGGDGDQPILKKSDAHVASGSKSKSKKKGGVHAVVASPQAGGGGGSAVKSGKKGRKGGRR